MKPMHFLIGLSLAGTSGQLIAQEKKNKFLPEAPFPHVASTKITLERYVLDDLPRDWSVSSGGKLTEDARVFRAGKKGMRWTWRKEGKLEIPVEDQLKKYLHKRHHKVSFAGGIGFKLWIYNEQPLKGKSLTISTAANGFAKQIKFGLNYKGWRACAIQFAEMPDGGNAKEGTFSISSPEGVRRGSIVLDRFEIGRLSAHTMADYQLPYSKNSNHWVNQYWWEKYELPVAVDAPTSEDKRHYATMESNILKRSLGWSLHLNQWSSDSERRLITSKKKSVEAKEAAKKLRIAARQNFNELKLKKLSGGGYNINITAPFRPAEPSYPNEVTWRHLEEVVFPQAVLDYYCFQDAESRKRVLNLLDWFEQQGVVAGHSYGSTSHIGYRSRNLAVGLFLLRDLLVKERKLDQWVETLKWLSGFAECRVDKKTKGGCGDDGTIAMARLICVLMQENTAQKKQDMALFMRWFNNALGLSDGTYGIIKPDYSFYHHAMMLVGYWSSNMPQFCKVLMAIEGTPYAQSDAWKNVRKNLIVYNRMFRGETQPFNLVGRKWKIGPDHRIADVTKLMALLGNPFSKKEQT